MDFSFGPDHIVKALIDLDARVSDAYTKDEANQIASQLQEQINAVVELPENLPYLDKQNVYTRTQTVDKTSGVAWKTKKDGNDTLKIHSDGTLEQIGTHNNGADGHLVNRKNLTDALDNVSLGSALEEADNNFKGSQSFRISGTHGSPIQVYAPKNGGGEQEIFAVSVVPANDDKVGERETESSAYYRGRIASDTSLVNKKYVDDAVESIDLEAYVTKENATSEITYRDKIFEEIFEDIDDALYELKRTDQTLTDGLATVNTDAAFLNKLNRFTAKQRIDVPDSVAFQITKNNAATLDVWSTGEVQQKDERPNSHPQQFVTRKNVEGMVNNYRPYTWVDHTVAGDLNPGECFVADNGYLYLSVKDADGNLVLLDGTYDFGEKSHVYYRNAAGEAVELFSITNVNVNQGSYIRFQGEEEVLKNAANSGMTHLESPLFI